MGSAVCPLLVICLCHVICVGLCMCSKDQGSDSVVKLAGSHWTVTNSNGSISSPATVPGSVYTDLVRNGRLGDPYYRFNDIAYRWVALDNWTYSREFQVSSTLLDRQVVNLVADGLDTIATIYVNKHQVAQTENMHRRYTLNIKSLLKQGTNSIQINFTSPVTYARSKAKSYPYDVPPDCPPDAQHGECHFNFIRKEASSFSWDWGPSFPTVGIWKNLTIHGFDEVSIETITVETIAMDTGDWLLDVGVLFDAHPTKKKLMAEINLTFLELNLTFNQKAVIFQGYAQPSVIINKSVNVSLWWPNGHGESRLYDMIVSYETLGGTDRGSKLVRVGFRTVELVQETIAGSQGKSFYFKINGVPIFMKGSNWIPADAFQERITPDYLRKLLTSAKLANMNMLRVWGGGVYESDIFYDLADELGITIWQDMMFACASYPSNEEFLDNVGQEVVYQIRRLKSHPSIVIWAGNNENEWGLAPFKNNESYPLYYKDYLKLYKDTVYAAYLQSDNTRPFVPSSPSNGVDTYRQGWVADNPDSNIFGDIHHYDYAADSWNWRSFPVPRFASEFGLQSWCSMESLQAVSIPSDLTPTSEFIQHRQHHPDGDEQMLQELSIHLNYSQSAGSLGDLIYLTQINQAEGIRTETELYRRSQSDVVNGYGRTMGALYWQLNDIWQGPTWASIEYGGKWKMLHYYARRFFALQALSAYLDNDTINVYYIDEQFHSKQATSNGRSTENKLDTTLKFEPRMGDAKVLYIWCFKWSSLIPAKSWKISFNNPTKASTKVFQADLLPILKEAGCPSRDHCLFRFSTNPDILASPYTWLLLSNFTTVQGLKTPKLQAVDFKKIDENTINFTLVTDQIAPYVWMEMQGANGYFSDNGFIMTRKQMIITFTSWTEITVDFKKAFRVRSLKEE